MPALEAADAEVRARAGETATVRRQAQNELERKLPFGPPAAPRYGRSA
jgi:hypothetical protein